jgi:hypothetical protein
LHIIEKINENKDNDLVKWSEVGVQKCVEEEARDTTLCREARHTNHELTQCLQRHRTEGI